MKHLLRADPGLPRRFPYNLDLASYSPEQLASIAGHCARTRFERELDDGLESKLAEHIRNHHRRDIDEQNGGLSVNLVEAAVARQQNRIMEAVRGGGDGGGDTSDSSADEYDKGGGVEESKMAVLHEGGAEELLLEDAAPPPPAPPLLLRTRSAQARAVKQHKRQQIESLRPNVLIAQDFGIADNLELGASDKEKAAIEAELEEMIGMDNVKQFFRRMRDTAAFVEMTGKVEALGGCLHLVLTGNPGTGKTTTARLVARYLKAFGILPTGTFKEINGLHLKGQYVGQTAHHVREVVRDALGGCLFIDEAYSLVQGGGGDSFGKEVIRTLLTEVETHRSDLLVIMAGYGGPMETLLDADPGLRSRFSSRLDLADYSPVEIAKIAELQARKKSFSFEEGLLPKLAAHIEAVHGRRVSTENGRLGVNLIDRAIERLASRLVNSGLTKAEICARQSVLTAADFEVAE